MCRFKVAVVICLAALVSGAGESIKPPVEATATVPFVASLISSPVSLNPIVEKRDRCRVNDAERCESSKEPGIPQDDLLEFRLMRAAIFIGVAEVVFRGLKDNDVRGRIKIMPPDHRIGSIH